MTRLATIAALLALGGCGITLNGPQGMAFDHPEVLSPNGGTCVIRANGDRLEVRNCSMVEQP